MKRRILPLLGSLAVVVGMYAGAYYAMVECTRVPLWVGAEGAIDSYSFGGEVSKSLFRPMNEIDAMLRPEVWGIRDVPDELKRN